MTTRSATSASAGASVIKARSVRSAPPGSIGPAARAPLGRHDRLGPVDGVPAPSPPPYPRRARRRMGSATAPTGEYMVIPIRR